MAYTISEKKALKRLGIDDFRHMTKDKVVSFLNMAPHMNPEVVKAAIEQFPEFKDMAVEMTNALKDIVSKAFDSEKDSQKFFYESANGMLKSLQVQLQDENIDAEERAQIRDYMMQIIDMIAKKDAEHKKFVRDIVWGAIAGVSALASAALVALGGKVDMPTDFLKDSNDHSDDV